MHVGAEASLWDTLPMSATVSDASCADVSSDPDHRLFRPRDCSDVVADSLARQRFPVGEVGTIQRLARMLTSARCEVSERVEAGPRGPSQQGASYESPYPAGHPRDRARACTPQHECRSRPLISCCADCAAQRLARIVPISAAGIPLPCRRSSLTSEQSRRRNNQCCSDVGTTPIMECRPRWSSYAR